MLATMTYLSARRQNLQDVLLTFRFVGKSLFLLTSIEQNMADLMLMYSGQIKTGSIDTQIGKAKFSIRVMRESNRIIRKHYETISDEENAYFPNIATSGSTCTMPEVLLIPGLDTDTCNRLADGMFSKPFVQYFDYFLVQVTDMLSRMQEQSRDAREWYGDKQWLTFQFLVARMHIPMYNSYSDAYVKSLENYQSIDSSRTWRTIYLIESLLYFVALSLFVYISVTLGSHAAVCSQTTTLINITK